MNAKKKRDKNRRRARRTAEQAWEAADEGDYQLALKIIRRAIGLAPGNPALWYDQGLLLSLAEADTIAAESFEAAICLAPDFAEAYASLAEIRARSGNLQQAVSLQRQAVQHSTQATQYRDRLAAYESMVGAYELPSDAAVVSTSQPQEQVVTSFPDVVSRVDELDWKTLADDLARKGFAYLPELLAPDQCATLRSMFDDDSVFSKTVTMDKAHFGRGVYRYFADPVPDLVTCIRQVVYRRAVSIVNEWQQWLGRNERYEQTWSEFQSRCADAGQCSPSPLLLRYEANGFNAPHRDLRGDVYFPLQLVIVLSARFDGGEFLFCDDPERKKSDRRKIAAGLGDAVLFCTRERLVRIAGVYGQKAVKHGMQRVTSGTRYAIGIPFHEFT